MPVNLELKALQSSLVHAEECARKHEARFLEDLRQTDTYFLVPKGRLKLREIEGKPSELIYYIRDETGDERRSTYRREQVEPASGTKSVLEAALGIRAVVRKYRRVYLYKGARIHLDRVDDLGTFIEFEVPGGGSVKPEAVMRELRLIFQIADSSIVRVSYADLVEMHSPKG